MTATTASSASKWLQALHETPEPAATPAAPDAPTGPVRPQKGVRWASVTGVPRVPVVGPAPALWVMGAHGGAGESTLAALLDGAAGTGHAWPVRQDGSKDGGGKDVVLLVCRSNAAGLRAAQLAAIEYGSGSLPGSLAGLVVTADAPGRPPKALADRIRLVAGAVPHLWQLPWVEAWRLAEAPDPASLPPAGRGVIDKLRLHTAAGN
ncbi:DUF6668 family protein [Sinomonas humi]|uniref:PH domain-containing protein n=1 Tax=Sinomonas humi TaxID=1338436 RepID=A0A0B2ALP5_9MICC|nr:DUF6668 family protein [Sinomonas humi]KHL02715.1 hypothetical protein LK10_11635 [Sinomonas humi]